jgi:spoIIIJ-associated protein
VSTEDTIAAEAEVEAAEVEAAEVEAADSDEEAAEAADSDEEAAEAADPDLLVREGDIAADYLEQLLDIADLDGDIDLDVENGRAVVAIVGSELRGLIGANGTTLDALQELVRLAVQQQTGERSRLMLDVGGYRQERRAQLAELARNTANSVRETGEPLRLTAMNPFERKVIHDAVATIEGVRSESEGEEPQRRVVVYPSN